MGSEKTINRIISGLTMCFYDPSDTTIKRELIASGYELYDTAMEEKLLEDMVILNKMALLNAYTGKALAMFPRHKYKRISQPVIDVQLIKSLECYLYQCCEGISNKKILYRMLVRITGILMSNSIHKTQVYVDAEWG